MALLTLVSGLLVSCNVSERLDTSKSAVVRFHQQLDSGKFSIIYREAGPEITRTTSEQEFEKFLSTAHQKLGKVSSVDFGEWSVNTDVSGVLVTLACTTKFGGLQAAEKFQWRQHNGKAQLVGYSIDSTALIMK